MGRAAADAGANMVERVGLTVVVAGVLTGLALAFTPVADNLSVAVCKVLNGGDAGGCETPSDEEYKPVCTVSSSSDTVGGKVDVYFVSVSADYTLMKTVTYDPVTGEKTVKVTGIKGKGVGVGGGVGPSTHFGGANAGVDFSGEARLKGSYGESWSFTGDNADADADALIDDLKEQYSIDAAKENGGAFLTSSAYAYDAVAGPDIPKPNVRTYEAEFGLSGSASAGATAGPKTKKPGGKHERKPGSGKGRGGRHAKPGPAPGAKPGAEGYLRLDGSAKATYEVNDKTGEESATYMLKGTATAGAQGGTGDEQTEGETVGSVKVTWGPDGNMKSVTLTAVRMVNGKATEVVTEIPTTTDRDRATVRSYMALLHDGTSALTFDDLVQTEDPGENGDPFLKLMYDKGKTSKADYAYDKTNENYSANVKLGMKLGAGLNVAGSSKHATGAKYLGAPGPDGRRRYKDYEECAGS